MALQRFKHNLSHYHLTTCDMGQLVPVGCIEVLPGDTFRQACAALVRVTPLVRPLMHPVQIKLHAWFVPNRLTYPGWEDFITQNDDTEVLPTITLTGSGEDLIDRLGPPVAAGLTINALPVRAYNLIYNEFYRDEQLTAAVSLDQTTILRSAWQRDYFTTCRPNPQQGAESIVSFSAGQAPIMGVAWRGDGSPDSVWRDAAGNTYGLAAGGPSATGDFAHGAVGPGTVAGTGSRPSNYMFAAADDGSGNEVGNPYADMTQATGGFSVSDLWAAEAQQRWKMKRNRFGDRYVDLLRALGVNPQDSRLNRPEYLGGGKQTIAFSEVLSTADTTGSSGQVVGDMAGHGIGAIRTRSYRRFFQEHGYVIVLMTIRPKTIYMDALHRTWIRSNYEDWWHKEYEIIAEQAVTNTEVYAPGGNSSTVFGYQQAHQDYRFEPSRVSGDFRNATSYDWHMARDFSSAPTLNGSFVECTPTDRVYADTGEPEIYAMVEHSIVARRLVRRFARNP